MRFGRSQLQYSVVKDVKRASLIEILLLVGFELVRGTALVRSRKLELKSFSKRDSNYS